MGDPFAELLEECGKAAHVSFTDFLTPRRGRGTCQQIKGERQGYWPGRGLEAGEGGRDLGPWAQPVLPAPVKEGGHSSQNLAPPDVWFSGEAQRQEN